MNEPIKNEATTLSPLAVKVNERLRVLCINKQMLAVQYHCSRSMISQYQMCIRDRLNGIFRFDTGSHKVIFKELPYPV